LDGITQDDRNGAIEMVDPNESGSDIFRNGWEERAKEAYDAAVASAVDAVMHYHRAATEILEAQRVLKLTGQKQLSQEEIGRRLGIGQPAVSKLLAWERKYGAQLAANEGVPVPSPYYSAPPATPEQVVERKNKKSGTAGVAAEAQRQYQEVQRDYEERLQKLTAELASKDDLLAELDSGPDAFPLVPAAGKDVPDVEAAIVTLLSNLTTVDEKLEVVRRVEARLRAELGSLS
jgi:DNA-binding CsgD family transcriptional regulator